MTNRIFKRVGFTGYARSTNVMCTQSETDFEWSVQLVDIGGFLLAGIASELKPKKSYIWRYDQNSILVYKEGASVIKLGSETIHSNLTELYTGDIIRFNFQPQAKKLVIDLPVRTWYQLISWHQLILYFRMDITKLVCATMSTTFRLFSVYQKLI